MLLILLAAVAISVVAIRRVVTSVVAIPIGASVVAVPIVASVAATAIACCC